MFNAPARLALRIVRALVQEAAFAGLAGGNGKLRLNVQCGQVDGDKLEGGEVRLDLLWRKVGEDNLNLDYSVDGLRLRIGVGSWNGIGGGARTAGE